MNHNLWFVEGLTENLLDISNDLMWSYKKALEKDFV